MCDDVLQFEVLHLLLCIPAKILFIDYAESVGVISEGVTLIYQFTWDKQSLRRQLQDLSLAASVSEFVSVYVFVCLWGPNILIIIQILDNLWLCFAGPHEKTCVFHYKFNFIRKKN